MENLTQSEQKVGTVGCGSKTRRRLSVSQSVTTKLQNYNLWSNGAYGNKLRIWSSIEEWEQSGFCGKVALRAKSGAGGQFCRYHLTPLEVPQAISDILSQGYSRDVIMVNEMAENSTLILQGEYLNNPYLGRDGYPTYGYFFYSRLPMPMREALKQAPQMAHGLRADLLIAHAMCPGSLEDWRALLDQYPDHVFEVSIFDGYVGDVPYRNAVVWEVRKY
jgi:hypothetical protein